MKRPRLALTHAILVALVPVACVLGQSPVWVAPKREADASDAFFKKGEIPRIDVTLTDEELQKLKAEPRNWVRARLTENLKVTLEGVGVKLKGAAGSFREWDERPALTVRVDKFEKGRTWKGLHKFHLNNSVQDDTWQCELLASELMRAAGLAATRVTHARVFLNGRDVGLYLVKEGFDTTFLGRHFADSTGNLYDGGFLNDIDADLEKDCGAGPDDRSDLKAMLTAAREPDLKVRWAQLPDHLDVRMFTTFMTMELLLNHWDGYTLTRNNYRLYFEPRTKKFMFLPHGMDQLWADTDASFLDMPTTILGSAVMKNPEWRAGFRKRLKDLLPLVAPPDRLLARADQIAAHLAPVIDKMGPTALKEYEGRVRELKARLAARAKFLLEHVNDPEPKPIDFRTTPVVTLRTWRKSPETEDARLAEVRTAGERQLLIAVGKSGKCVASWRKTVPLVKGRYRFLASVRTEDVQPLQEPENPGAGIRVAAVPRTSKLVGTSAWKSMEFDFEVTEEVRDVDLVLELRASKGQVFFNTESLKLKKLG